MFLNTFRFMYMTKQMILWLYFKHSISQRCISPMDS